VHDWNILAAAPIRIRLNNFFIAGFIFIIIS
jgi:hypothetical protein